MLWKTWFWVATALWMCGAAIASFSPKQLWAIPLYVLSFVIHGHQFVADPNPPCRRAIATFALLAAMTAFAILFAVIADLLNQMAENQAQMLDLINGVVELQKRLLK